MGLVRVIYVSAARPDVGAPEIASILDSATRNNAARGITGMLLFAGGSFMQVLEGEEPAVLETLSRIARDRRHTALIELEHSAIAERSFVRWHMGFRSLAAAEAVAHPAYAPFFRAGFDPATLGAKPGVALEMLQEFARSNT